jgi:hypothetical protein
MITRLTLGAAAVAAVAFCAPVSAAPLTTQTPVSEETLVQQVHWRGYRNCRYWRHECAYRWGWGTRRYHRCLWRQDCGRW